MVSRQRGQAIRVQLELARQLDLPDRHLANLVDAGTKQLAHRFAKPIGLQRLHIDKVGHHDGVVLRQGVGIGGGRAKPGHHVVADPTGVEPRQNIIGEQPALFKRQLTRPGTAEQSRACERDAGHPGDAAQGLRIHPHQAARHLHRVRLTMLTGFGLSTMLAMKRLCTKRVCAVETTWPVANSMTRTLSSNPSLVAV